MKTAMSNVRNQIEGAAYRKVLKPLLFRRDPEDVHDRMSAVSELLGKHALGRGVVRTAFGFRHPALAQTLVGIRFGNPIGLAAGFDKNARLVDFMPAAGFGFMEVGSITGEPCEGNPKPRLWRLPKSQAIVVNYGLMNDGAEVVSARLKGRRFAAPVGISIAKTNCESTVQTNAGIADYVKAYRAFEGIGSYCTINISCPNTFGGQPFTDGTRLEKLLAAIDKEPHTKPVFVKLSPDFSEGQMDELIAVATNHNVQGFVCSNLTKSRNNDRIRDANVPETGGMSGKVQEGLSDAQVRYVYRRTGGKYLIIGCGGVFSAEDAYRKIRAGASLVQLITGMIYQGPQLMSSINMGLVRLLERDGFKNVSEAVGRDA